jgi:hypothetical protein
MLGTTLDDTDGVVEIVIFDEIDGVDEPEGDILPKDAVPDADKLPTDALADSDIVTLDEG